jgi:hypothetical protein
MNAGAWVARRRRAVFEPVGNRKDSAPRFSRFAAAMEAAPPPSAQVLPHDGSTAAAPRLEAPRVTPPRAAATLAARPIVVERPPAGPPAAERVTPEPIVVAPGPRVVPEWKEPEPVAQAVPIAYGEMTPPVMPRRPVVEDSGRGDIPWLGIGSWLLLCGALFASLIGWPSQTSLDRVSQLWSDSVWSTEPAAGPGQQAPNPVQSAALPQDPQAWTALPDTAGDPQTLPPTELAPPIGSAGSDGTVERIPGGPPLPQFKPIVDGVAAKFSNAFFEMGERLQQEGDTDAAIHMRRQGSKLDPWRTSGGSEL